MSAPYPIGRRLQELRRASGLSALAVSKAARLSVNYVRQLERGGRFPKPDKLAAVARALNLDAATITELRRLAGIDPDPGATPEAKAARRGAWRPLLFILVNHVLLPRLELEALLSGKRRLRDQDRDLVARAAASFDFASFVAETASAGPPGPSLRRLIERTFEAALPEDVAHVQRQIRNELETRSPRGLGPEHGEPYRWHQRWAIARLLLGFNRPAHPEAKLYLYIHESTFDYNFAVCLFPAIYWAACHAWPFEKLLMPYARRGPELQRRLYDAVRGGLALDPFDRALTGDGALGAALTASPPARPSPEDLVEPHGKDRVRLTLRTHGRTHWSEGPRPPVDAVFDHLDRCEFLERFPILKIDRQGAGEIARSLTLPSWVTWTNYIAGWKFPSDQPPRSVDRFAHVIGEVRKRDAAEDEPQTLDSYIGRRLAEESADALARLLGRGRWDTAVQAAQALEVRPHWLAILRALADYQQRTAPPPGSPAPTAPSPAPSD